MSIRQRFGLAAALLLLSPVGAMPALAAGSSGTHATVKLEPAGISIGDGHNTVAVQLVAANIVRVHFMPDGKSSASSVVIDPGLDRKPYAATRVQRQAQGATLSTSQLLAHWDQLAGQLQVGTPGQPALLQVDLRTLAHGSIVLTHASGDALYGLRGYDNVEDASAGLLRTSHVQAKAGEQGHAGGPLVWSTGGYALLVDTDGGWFDLGKDRISFDRGSRKDLDFYLLLGTPARIFAAVADLSGHSQLFPKWAMGFTNSQWGIDQKELLAIVDGYRARHIPIDNFTLDFDWKAWGEAWGEFRWNPAKFPDGPDGKLKLALDSRHMHLTGIMKPRMHVDTVEGRYASEHDLWIDGRPASPDYFSFKPVRDLDFNKPATRAWFFNDALKHSFDTGMVGWWNDEADNYDNTQFLNMERTLYDGQRALSPLRVWSINRNFYLGSQRYAYGVWSGDIATGFTSMAAQRPRMLSAINVGAMQWGMDGGGFTGHPSNENYARWIEFGAFTPIFRVHGVINEKRQPWVYGPVAEKAATDAIRLRYALIPYIYSYEYQRHLDGVGLVRPLLFEWPQDQKLRNDSDAWLFGDYLLVSPVVQQGQTSKDIYLPAGQWTDWFSGKTYEGDQTITMAIDSKGWSDIPLFIRAGAIIPLQPAEDYVGQHALTELAVEMFPAVRRSSFDYYDDDGTTYAYEHGKSFRQNLTLEHAGDTVVIDVGSASGSFKPALKFYLLHVHGAAADSIKGNVALKSFASLADLQSSDAEGWSTGTDRFGAVTFIRVKAAAARHLTLGWGR